jgi:hypothetical protein
MLSATKRHLLDSMANSLGSKAGVAGLYQLWSPGLANEPSSLDVKVIPHWAELRTRVGHQPCCCATQCPSVLSGRALDAEEIAVDPFVTRANIRVSVKESQGRALVNVPHLMDGRRDRTDRHVRSSHERR